MSGFFRCQVSIPMDSGTPEDSVINVWHFDSDQTFAEDADDVVGRLRTFYQSIDTLFPAHVGSTATVKVYDLADPEPRVPGIIDTIALTPAAGGTVIPHEVAICLSMKADPVSGVSAGRLRGRVFLGPLTTSVLALEGSQVRITAAARTTVVNAAVALATGPDPGDARLAIYSPTTHAALGGGAGSLADAFNDVTEVWVDNAPDTIRSRGEKSSARTTAAI
jgi:hypothetical protein